MKHFYLLFFTVLFTTSYSQQAQKGGFTDQWSSYSNDDLIGLGNRIVNWDSTGLVDIVHAPAVGVHPRVYFGPSEIPDIVRRLDSTTSGNAIKKVIEAHCRLLHLKYISGGYNQNASYAKDNDNNRLIDNAGAWNFGPFYDKLKVQDASVWTGIPIKSRHRTASLMAMEAFVCLLYPSYTDPVIGKTTSVRATELATAMNFWARLVLNDATLDPNGMDFNMLGGTHMALCYDFNYNNMTVSQRDTVRLALSKVIPEHPRHGGDLTSYANTSNWCTLNSFEIVMNLSIEGEPGYDSTLTREWMRAYHTFINYGWYPSGAGYEGLGKNYQYVTTMIVAAKRGYSLLGHPHVRAYGEKFLPAIMQPFGHGFTSYDVWGGSGYDAEKGQYKFSSADVVGLKWIYPNSQKIDFVWRNYISSFHQNTSKGYVYQQVLADDSYNSYLIPAAIFAKDYSSSTWQAQANQVATTDFVAMDRGLAVFKTGSDSNALATQFHVRQDMGGHTHGDRLDFTLSGLGRIWIRKSYGGSPFQPSDFHSMILIDGKGMGVGDPDGDKCRQPATMLDYSVSDQISTASADATYAYSWEWHWSPQDSANDHPWLGTGGWTKVTETWNDFLVTQHPEAQYNIPFYDFPHWHQPTKIEKMIKRPYNPMGNMVRNTALVKGKHPYLLVVDDVKKDSITHNYKWIAQIARDLSLDTVIINLKDSNYRYDMIFKEPTTTGNRRLLVRVLNKANMDSVSAPGYMDTLSYVNFFNGSSYSPNPNWVRPRLIVESNSVEPNFKVMLFPFESGDELPTTIWNKTRDTLTNQFSDDTIQIKLEAKMNYTDISIIQKQYASLDELEENKISIYPNPANNIVSINGSKIIDRIIVYSTDGKLVSDVNRVNNTSYSLNVESFISGIYWVRVYSGETIITKKLVVTK